MAIDTWNGQTIGNDVFYIYKYPNYIGSDKQADKNKKYLEKRKNMIRKSNEKIV